MAWRTISRLRLVLAVEPGLEVAEAVTVPLELVGDVLLALVVLGLVGVDVGQARGPARLDPPAWVVGPRRRVLDDRPLGMGEVVGLGGHRVGDRGRPAGGRLAGAAAAPAGPPARTGVGPLCH
jgi:hypothetical protein